eukprot:COSAG01_NODE_7343_length_3242_cov_19.776010_2_plen_112_part_00
MIVCVASSLYHFHSLYSLACAQPLTFVVCTTGALQTRQHTATNIDMTKEGTNISTSQNMIGSGANATTDRDIVPSVRNAHAASAKLHHQPVCSSLLMFVFSFGVAGVRSSN